MFVDFLYTLRRAGLPVSTTEFLTLLDALQAGLARSSLDRFYAVARAILVKRPEHFDLYDQAFAAYFADASFTPDARAQLFDELLSWLDDPLLPRDLTDAERDALAQLDLDALREQFEQRLREQDSRHDGGSHWIGTGGTSPFGHGGEHPSGVRVGGRGRNRSALQIATERRFRNLRKDLTLDVRDIGVALRRLRELGRDGHPHELDLDATIDATAKNAGDIDLVFRPPRKNALKLLLLCDVGGSMDPYSQLTSRLFSAAHQAHHFKQFHSYYFHNCPYETLYTDMARREGVPTDSVLRNLDPSWRCIVVGDAAMAPTELTHAGGSVDYWHINQKPGIDTLRALSRAVPRTVWLNPDRPNWWGSWTTQVIRRLFPMFPFTMDGLEAAIARLRARPRA